MERAGNGRTVQLSARLQTLADMVTPGSRVADVGCDHGFVAIYLVQYGLSPRVIAADVRQGPLSRARSHVAEQGLEAYIETRLSDGLRQIHAGEVDTLICAGMGGRLMQRILRQDADTAACLKELILQPQSELEELRRFLRQEKYQTVQENIIYEEGKYYFFMKVLPPGGVKGNAEPEKGNAEPEKGNAGAEKGNAGAEKGNAEPEKGNAEPEKGNAEPEKESKGAGRDIPQRLADKYGELLLRERNPVLREYLEWMQATYSRVAEEIQSQAGNAARAEKRLAEIRAELSDIAETLKYYTQEGRE